MNDMKKIISNILLCAMAVFAVAACSDPEAEKLEKIVGEWHYTGTESGVGVDVYLGLSQDYTFELYQKLDNGAFELRRGKWHLEAGVLSGTYNDGEAWATSYKTAVSDETLTLVAQSEGSETNRYKKCEIPAAIKDNCEVVVKSRP